LRLKEVQEIPDPRDWIQVLRPSLDVHCRVCKPFTGKDKQGNYSVQKIRWIFRCVGNKDGTDKTCNNECPPLLNLVSTQPTECTLCREDQQYFLQFECQHKICIACWPKHFEAQRAKKELTYNPDTQILSVKCFSRGCTATIQEPHIFRLLGNSVYEVYKKSGAEMAVLQNGGEKCPFPNCSAVFLSGNNMENSQHLKCPRCSQWFCRKCNHESKFCGCVHGFNTTTTIKDVDATSSFKKNPVGGTSICLVLDNITLNKTYKLDVHTSDSVGYLKTLISQEDRIPVQNIHIYYAGQDLLNATVVCDSYMAKGTIIQVVIEPESTTEIPPIQESQACEAAHAELHKIGKQCPKCSCWSVHFFGEGCHHITCNQCKHQYCYVCKAKWRSCRCPRFCGETCGCPKHPKS